MKVILDSYRISELRGEQNLPLRGRVFDTAYVTAPEENKNQTAIKKKVRYNKIRQTEKNEGKKDDS